MLRETMLMKLPEFRDNWKLIKKRQSVKDIMNLVLKSHDQFGNDYDTIASSFASNTDEQTLRNIFDFLKQGVKYVREPGSEQVVKSPAAIIETGEVDCKGYAGFIAGVIDALNRRGGNISFCYVFAWYGGGQDGHVFVETELDGEQIWVDPVLSSFNSRNPMPTRTRKFYKDMALYQLSGVPSDAKGFDTPDTVQQCVVPFESLDQQIMRLTRCSSSIDAGTIVPASSDPTLYELPVKEPLQPAPPIDVLVMDPGQPKTMQQPAPGGTNPDTDNPSSLSTTDNPAPIPKPENGAITWVKDNPWLAAMIAAGIVYWASKKKRRA